MTNLDKILRPLNPFTLQAVGEYSLKDYGEIQAIVANAQKAALAWRKVALDQRVQWFRMGLQYFERNRAAIARDITLQMGKPIGQSENELKGFFERADYLLANAASILAPEILSEKTGFHRRIEHVPLGVILVIAPWNYPLLTAINGIATALLAGNAVILKHSSLTPTIGEHFAKAFGRLGLSGANAINIPGGEDLEILQAMLASHEDLGRIIAEGDIDHVVFTGSVEGGRTVQKAAAHRFIDCNLELGGKDGAYVAADADIAKAAADLVDGAMYNAGQSCCGIERVYVHQKLYADFVDRCQVIAREYILGDPLHPQTTMGPLSSARAATNMVRQIEDAKAKGAKVLVGGQTRLIGKGTFFEPTILTHANHTMEVLREENFGPILPIVSVQDDDEAIRLINDSPYGLTSTIYSRDLDLANRFAKEANTGTVFMNRCDYLDPALPWTGVRDSGRGSTLSKYGFYSLTRRKSIHFRLP